MPAEHKRKVAIVIGSGGIKTAASIGVMQALEEEGVEVEMVVGCSGGAVFGAAIALGFSPEKMATVREQAWTADVTSKKNYRKIASAIAPRLLDFDETFSIFDDSIMLGNIARAFGEETTFADTVIPFFCVATDFYTGKPFVISKGPLAEAIRISSGIPLVFGARKWEDSLLIDGALSNPLPIDVAMSEGADVIIAIGFESSIEQNVTSFGHFASQMFNILINQLMTKKLAFFNLSHHSEIIMIMPKFEERIRVNDVHKVPEIIEKGKIEMQKQLDYLNKLLGT